MSQKVMSFIKNGYCKTFAENFADARLFRKCDEYYNKLDCFYKLMPNSSKKCIRCNEFERLVEKNVARIEKRYTLKLKINIRRANWYGSENCSVNRRLDIYPILNIWDNNTLINKADMIFNRNRAVIVIAEYPENIEIGNRIDRLMLKGINNRSLVYFKNLEEYIVKYARWI